MPSSLDGAAVSGRPAAKYKAVLWIVIVVLGVLASCGTAHAQNSETSAIPRSRAFRLDWRPEWRKANVLDYALTAGALGGAAVASLVGRAEREPDWREPILFDHWLRDRLVANTASGRNTSATVSDFALWTSVAQVTSDATFVAMFADDAPNVGWQMLAMDAESYSVSVLLESLTKRVTARARPDAEACAKDAHYSRNCNAPGPNASFYSGHASLSATSAGLMCVQHSQLALYGGAWDGAACVSGIALSTLTGALRIAADRHWASDVITGDLLGFTAGYFLPQLMHFRPNTRPPKSASLLAVLPVPTNEGISFAAVGRF